MRERATETDSFAPQLFCIHFVPILCVCSFVCVCVGGGVGHLKFIYHIKEIISLVLPWLRGCEEEEK